MHASSPRPVVLARVVAAVALLLGAGALLAGPASAGATGADPTGTDPTGATNLPVWVGVPVALLGAAGVAAIALRRRGGGPGAHE